MRDSKIVSDRIITFVMVLFSRLVRTRTDEELEFLPYEKFRKDYLRFGWEGGNSTSAAKLRFQYMFPQSLRWVGDLIFGCVMDNKSVLKLDTNHLKEVSSEKNCLHVYRHCRLDKKRNTDMCFVLCVVVREGHHRELRPVHLSGSL